MDYSENINFKALSTFHNNINKNNSISNTIKPNNYSLDKDTVEINKTETTSNDSKKSKLIKWGAIVGSGIVATTIGVLTAKHISVKNAKKAAEELKKIKLQELEKAKAEQLKKAEEARIAQEKALKAQQEAREKAIQEAKIRAEKEAKIKAEKEAEAARIAQEKADKKIIDGLFKDFDETVGTDALKDIFGGNIRQTNSFKNGVVDVLKKAEEKGIAEEKVKKLYSTLAEQNNLNNSQIESLLADAQLPPSHSLGRQHELMARRDLVQGVETLKQTVPQKEGEKYSEYIERLMETHNTNVSIKNEEHVRNLRSNIHYSDVEPPKSELTDDELKILQEWRPEEYKDKSKEEALKRLSRYDYCWARTYTSGADGGNLPEDIEHILISKALPRYNSQTHRMPGGKKSKTPKPVARWMNIPRVTPDGIRVDNPERFIQDTFKVGGKYVAPAKQSCSMDLKSAGDACFADDYYNDIKFIIHPKSSTSKAGDISAVIDESFQYGYNEVIYPKGTEFNVLDKRVEDFIHKDGNHHYGWVIEMQEA